MRIYVLESKYKHRIIEMNLVKMVDRFVVCDLIDTAFSLNDIVTELKGKSFILDFGDMHNKCHCQFMGYNVKTNLISFSVSLEELQDKRKYQYINISAKLPIILLDTYKTVEVKVNFIGFEGFIFEMNKDLNDGLEIILILETVFNKFHLDACIVNKYDKQTKEGNFIYVAKFENLEIKPLNSDALYDYLCKESKN